MKIFITSSALIIAIFHCCLSSPSLQAQPDAVVPLEIGNMWIYGWEYEYVESRLGGGNRSLWGTQVWEVVADTIVDDHEAFIISVYGIGEHSSTKSITVARADSSLFAMTTEDYCTLDTLSSTNIPRRLRTLYDAELPVKAQKIDSVICQSDESLTSLSLSLERGQAEAGSSIFGVAAVSESRHYYMNTFEHSLTVETSCLHGFGITRRKEVSNNRGSQSSSTFDFSLRGAIIGGVRYGDTDLTTSVNDQLQRPTAGEARIVSIPNPIVQTVNFTLWGVPKDPNFKVEIFDMMGRKADLDIQGQFDKLGYQEINFDASGLAPGSYFAALKYDGKIQANVLVLKQP